MGKQCKQPVASKEKRPRKCSKTRTNWSKKSSLTRTRIRTVSSPTKSSQVRNTTSYEPITTKLAQHSTTTIFVTNCGYERYSSSHWNVARALRLHRHFHLCPGPIHIYY